MSADWHNFSAQYVDTATGFRWFVDCLGATSTNQQEAELCTLQFQHAELVRFATADPSNLGDPDEIADAFARSQLRPPRRA